MKTEQFNIRLSQELVRDLDVISNLLKVNKSEWVRTKLAEEVHEEKTRLLLELSTLYAKGMISKSDVERLAGKEIAEEMEFMKNKAIETVSKGAEYGRKLRKKFHN